MTKILGCTVIGSDPPVNCLRSGEQITLIGNTDTRLRKGRTLIHREQFWGSWSDSVFGWSGKLQKCYPRHLESSYSAHLYIAPGFCFACANCSFAIGRIFIVCLCTIGHLVQTMCARNVSKWYCAHINLIICVCRKQYDLSDLHFGSIFVERRADIVWRLFFRVIRSSGQFHFLCSCRGGKICEYNRSNSLFVLCPWHFCPHTRLSWLQRLSPRHLH